MTFSINAKTIPKPESLTQIEYDITEGERDSTGLMHLDLIATKSKLQASWGVLTKSELKTLMSAMSSLAFKVKFDDAVTGSVKTITCYKGDRTIPTLVYINDEPYYKGFSVNFIEM